MDRRTLLAIALSFIFITIWMQIFGPKPPEVDETAPPPELVDDTVPGRQPGEAPPAVLGEAGDVPPAVDPSAPAAETLAFESDRSASTIEVEMPLYTAVFSSRGAGIVTFIPTRYEREDGDPLDLVPGDVAQPVLSVDRDGPRGYAAVDLSGVVFDVRRESGRELPIEALVFTAESTDGVRVERTYRFAPDTYAIHTEVAVSGLPEGLEGSYTLAWTAGLPTTEAQVDLDLSEFGALVKVGTNMEKEKLTHFVTDDTVERYEGEVLWAATKAKYFLAALIVDEAEAESARTFGDVTEQRVGYAMESPLAGGRGAGTYALYVGPIKQEQLSKLHAAIPHADIERYVGISTMPLGSVFGWFAEITYKAMMALHAVVPNYGVVILLLALITKAIFFPLTRRSSQSMRAMADLKPELEALREKYKNDPQKMNAETFALYKKHGINPVAGCLPLLIQMPVFMALYGVLRSAIELRQAPFVLWVNDLSAPDTLISFGNVPFFPDALHVLPLLMAGSTILMQRRAITDPRQQSLMFLMPFMMLFFFYNLPSGLNLYWTSQNLLAWAEQSIAKGKTTPATAKAA